MAAGPRYRCTFLKACNALYIVLVEGKSLTHAAVVIGLNVGTVCHIVHGRRFPGAFPIAPGF
jgi:hypothetical protein